MARKSNVLTFESERVARAELESRLTVRCEENFDRHLAMQKRRGRRYDPDYVRPTRDPELLGMKYSKKDDDTPIGSWAAAKHYVPPPEERPGEPVGRRGGAGGCGGSSRVWHPHGYGRHEQGYKHEHGGTDAGPGGGLPGARARRAKGGATRDGVHAVGRRPSGGEFILISNRRLDD